MDSLYFDTFDIASDIDSSPSEAGASDSFCTDNDDFLCIKCKRRKDGKLCQKCRLRRYGISEKPKKSPLELASTGQLPDRSDNGDATGYALDAFGFSKFTGPRSVVPDSPRKEEKVEEEKKPRETNCWVTSALGQWVQYEPSPPPEIRTRSQSIERRCQCSRFRRCSRCENLPHQSNRRAWEERNRSGATTPKEEVMVEEVLYESTRWEFDNGYTHTYTHTHTHTHTHTKSVVRASDWERPYNPPCLVQLVRPSADNQRPRRHMAEIWSYTSGRRLSRWPMEFYVMPLCGTLTWPHRHSLPLGPGSFYPRDLFGLLWSMFKGWVAGKYKQLVAYTRRILGFGDSHVPGELD
ncbi:hypothetical protein GGR53DRAFT_446448 [Hypoxylon sp. FL1150]|nr:hypothetical protein GGR53DRAFT_446448 [Hypoxylon sp. FL1150]